MNTKIYKIQMPGGGMERWRRCQGKRFGGTGPRVKTNCELASSHSEERGDGGRWSKKREGRGDDATRINRVTVWMQHTSLPLTNKAVREKKLERRRPLVQRRVQCIVWASASKHVPSIALVLLEREDHTRGKPKPASLRATISTRRRMRTDHFDRASCAVATALETFLSK